MRLPLGILNFLLRHTEKRGLRNGRPVKRARRMFSLQARLFFRAPSNTTQWTEMLGDKPETIAATWLDARMDQNDQADGVILYFHGGGYVIGSAATHSALLARLSLLSDCQAVLPDYRLAPEHPFPAAISDALNAYRALLNKTRSQRIILGGDSAGGGLMLGLLHEILRLNLPAPAAVFALSPWTDLTLASPSLVKNAKVDPILPTERVAQTAAQYLGQHDPSDPRASPVFGNFQGAPPVYITVADTEILLDDSKRMVDRLRCQGVTVQFEVRKDLPHVWPIFQGYLKQADETQQEVAAFISANLVKSS